MFEAWPCRMLQSVVQEMTLRRRALLIHDGPKLSCVSQTVGPAGWKHCQLVSDGDSGCRGCLLWPCRANLTAPRPQVTSSQVLLDDRRNARLFCCKFASYNPPKASCSSSCRLVEHCHTYHRRILHHCMTRVVRPTSAVASRWQQPDKSGSACHCMTVSLPSSGTSQSICS